VRIGATLLLSVAILTAAAGLRPPEYDEAYSIFLTAGDPRPAWPAGIFHPGEVRSFYQGSPTWAQIAHNLRTSDVHPPLYFWLLEIWRRIFGPSWFAARMLSVLFSIAALAALAWLAALAEIPESALLITLLSYGFAYTGIVARGFALAQALNILGMAFTLSATRNRNRALGFAAGLAFGAATFTNYLAVFIGLAAFAWLAIERRRHLLLPAGLGFALFLPILIPFYLAQRNSRIGQFQHFSPPHAIALLAKDFGAALFGGLPVYAGRAGGIVTAALVLLAAICTACIVKRWQPNCTVFALSVLAVPAGLLALGVLFNNTPIEIRYLAFATPFIALLLAQTLPPALRTLLLCVQACGIIGLIFAPATMQPQGLAARQIAALNQPAALVLLPFGNDGVGIPGPFIAAAPDSLRLQLIRPNAQPAQAREQTVIVATIRADAASKTTVTAALSALRNDPCWRPDPATALAARFSRRCGPR
jgi:4-amino-4-deoxy-L-arabinose transferase-like glycosyltransferase